MTNFIIAVDDKNIELGQYFLKCKDDITGFINDDGLKIENNTIIVNSDNCKQEFITSEVSKYNHQPFVFIAYSHGNEDSLRCNGSSYVKKGLNSKRFKNSLFYTNSCLCGKELGEDLIKNECKAFIGFSEESYCFLEDEYIDTNMNCDNSGIKCFFQEDITIGQAFERMKNYYTSKIDKYLEIGDPFFASYLVKNREALTMFGQSDLKKSNFNI